MLRFSDLDKKGATKEAEPDSSVLEDLSQEQEESIKFDRKSQNMKNFMFDVLCEFLGIVEVVGADVDMTRYWSVQVWFLTVINYR